MASWRRASCQRFHTSCGSSWQLRCRTSSRRDTDFTLHVKSYQPRYSSHLFRKGCISAISANIVWHVPQQRSTFFDSASPATIRARTCCTEMHIIELTARIVLLFTSDNDLLTLLQALMALRVVSCLCQHGATAAQLLRFLKQWYYVPDQDAEPEAVMAALTGAAGLCPTETVAAVVKYPSVLQHPPDEVRQRVGQQLPQTTDGPNGSQATQSAQKCVLSPGYYCHACTLRL